jgi:predicted polyphosphate/ATP-dependent NAD kinase
MDVKKKIGLIVNPVAGMGGSVGLKGTDGALYKQARELGAKPVTPVRTRDVFEHIKRQGRIDLYTAPGAMGAEYVQDFFRTPVLVGSIAGETTGKDTKDIAAAMVGRGVELLVFVGGDGTARDVCDAVGLSVPVVAVPSGVKVFSAVFSYSARAAAEMIDAFIEGADTAEEEVLDIDEEAFRDNRLSSKLYGYLLVPSVRRFLQGGKECSSSSVSAASKKREIASYIVNTMEKGVLYLLGPGTTLKAVAEKAGIEKTLLGVDACADGEIVGTDLNEEGILSILRRYDKRKIIVTPIGGNGFIFGRGSKQFTPEVLRLVGRKNIIVVAGPDKLYKLDSLRVDTGDYETDRLLSGSINVIVGEREFTKMEVLC